jgi:hypothetical protein
MLQRLDRERALEGTIRRHDQLGRTKTPLWQGLQRPLFF